MPLPAPIYISFIRIILFSLSMLFVSYTPAQEKIPPDAEPPLNDQWKQTIEMYAESNGIEDTDFSDLFDQLSYYVSHPLNLNRASKVQLEDLPLLSELQIVALLDHIARNGTLLNVYELQSINGFDAGTIRLILPFITVTEQSEPTSRSIRDLFKGGSNTISFRYSRVLEQEKGFATTDSLSQKSGKSSGYLGSPEKLILNYRFRFRNGLSWGLSARKDPGEQFFRGGEKNGFDFYSLHFLMHTRGLIRTVVLGDYQAGFGQGLITWSGVAFNKTSDACLIRRIGSGLRPYTASSKNNFLRGAGICLQFGKAEITLFCSYKKLDATVTDTSLNGRVLQVRTIQTTGLHNTAQALAAKGKLGETVEGGRLAFPGKRFNAGITTLLVTYDAALEPKPAPYNRFEFRGKEAINGGMDYTLVFRNINLFGEAACSADNGLSETPPSFGVVQGLLVAADERMSFSMLWRNYKRDFHSPYANGFREGSKTANEQGLYTGITLRPGPSITLTAFYDYFNFPWLRYRVNAPSAGNDCFVKLSWNPNKRTSCYIHWRIKEKSLDPPASSNPDEINYPVARKQSNFRVNLSMEACTWLHLNTRMEVIQETDSVSTLETGFLLFQSLIIHKKGLPLSLTTSYGLFDTPSGNTRIYAYEKGVPGSFAVPSFSGRGSRLSTVCRYDLNRQWKLWISFTRTFYDNLHSIGAGTLDQINGNRKSELSLELKFNF
jgi:hypothetical protein